ncbi:C25 family cysteine peptidase [Massilia pseudoviolaceinigra]|uniref:C25 family cysteine peptidase n=1 Tax=Massilia pseudoviolaceinigra TaxID=3057165 RepID=UPI002796BC01|nr:radical SAM protein [Massilia sp. CCM 9206]MDQ1922304.1 radical SAM protein [Massilia sp. CCM 9206]
MTDESDAPLSFGIHADTGRPLGDASEGLDATRMHAAEVKLRTLTEAMDRSGDVFGVPSEIDPDNLAEAGWGIIFAAGADPTPYLDAMDELVALRRRQAGEYFRIFSGPDGYRPGETANQWLVRHGSAFTLIDPDSGVPYYLTIVGPPTDVPFEFQYALDIVAAVGRLDFTSLADLSAYARSVVSFENNAALMTRRQIELFATCHDFDRASQLFTKQVAIPWSTGGAKAVPLGKKFGFSLNPTLQEQATKEALTRILNNVGAPPSILFTGTHGMAFSVDDQRQAENQGALVCHEWPGYGGISSEHWFAASDVPADANVHGMIHFFFACYGAGTPEFDNFHFQETQSRIMPKPATSRLPQTLMALPQGGVLASLGHVDRAWASSFQSERGVAQTQGFRDVLGLLMAGQRIGHATNQFNGQWGVLSTELVNMLQEKLYGKAVRESALLAARIARDDCRNYVVLGDPAIKLRPEPRAV